MIRSTVQATPHLRPPKSSLRSNFKLLFACPLWFSLLSVMLACNPSRQCDSVPKEKFMNSLTSIHLDIQIPDNELQSWADTMLPDTLFQDDGMGDQNVDILVKKNGPPFLQLQGKTATAEIPLSIHAAKSLGFMKAAAEGSMILKLHSDIDISKDWTWSSQTSIDSIEWIEEPKLKVLGIKLSVKSMVDNYIKNSEAELTGQIDQAVTDNQLLKNVLGNAQPSFERSYAVDPDGQFFVQVFPQIAGMAPFENKRNTVHSAVGLRGMAILHMDSSQTSNQVDTPVYQWIHRDKEDHNISANIQLSEKDLQDVSRNLIKGETIEFRGKKSTIDQMNLTLQNKKVKADIYISGGIRGMVHFEGVPQWDHDRSQLEFCDADVQLQIEKGLPRFLIWLFKPLIRKKMIRELEDSINSEIDARIREINKYLKDYEIGPKFFMSASIRDHAIDPIQIEDKNLQMGVRMNVKGNMKVQGLKINFD